MTRLWKISAALLLLAAIHSLASAQPPTATAAPLNLSTIAPQEQEASDATATWTPTPEGQVMIEARDFANVRAEPDTNATQLGQIRSGDLYPATGRYFQWIQFQFDQTRRGWVFGELVNVVGDVNSLPEIGVSATTPEATEELGAAATLAAVTQTPGGVLTATAIARQNAIVSDLPANAGIEQPSSAILPTFTYPPGVVAIAPTPGGNAVIPTESNTPLIDASSGGVPPIVPLLVLGGIGLLGLAMSSLRR
jgi:hypothetical protein